MDVSGTPFLYGGAMDAPLLTEAEDGLYLVLTLGGVMKIDQPQHPHDLAGSLRLIAERLECDTQVARLRDRIVCRAGFGDRREGDLHCVAACVTIYFGGTRRVPNSQIASLNAAAACRLANRLDSGLEPAEAIRRTLEECERHAYTPAQLEALERNANAWQRKLDHIDREHDRDLGSPEHLDAIRQASTQLGFP